MHAKMKGRRLYIPAPFIMVKLEKRLTLSLPLESFLLLARVLSDYGSDVHAQAFDTMCRRFFAAFEFYSDLIDAV